MDLRDRRRGERDLQVRATDSGMGNSVADSESEVESLPQDVPLRCRYYEGCEDEYRRLQQEEWDRQHNDSRCEEDNTINDESSLLLDQDAASEEINANHQGVGGIDEEEPRRRRHNDNDSTARDVDQLNCDTDEETTYNYGNLTEDDSVATESPSDEEDDFMKDRQPTEDYSEYKNCIFDYSPRSNRGAGKLLVEEIRDANEETSGRSEGDGRAKNEEGAKEEQNDVGGKEEIDAEKLIVELREYGEDKNKEENTGRTKQTSEENKKGKEENFAEKEHPDLMMSEEEFALGREKRKELFEDLKKACREMQKVEERLQNANEEKFEEKRIGVEENQSENLWEKAYLTVSYLTFLSTIT